jgi:hypothetical protein
MQPCRNGGLQQVLMGENNLRGWGDLSGPCPGNIDVVSGGTQWRWTSKMAQYLFNKMDDWDDSLKLLLPTRLLLLNCYVVILVPNLYALEHP